MGDFNEVLIGDDKFRGGAVNISRALRFKECLDFCRMIGLGPSGARFTWSNRCPVTSLIQERLDRVFANSEWNELYPDAYVQHLERVHSDHCPVLLSLHRLPFAFFPRPFRFQQMWLLHFSFFHLVCDVWIDAPNLQLAIDQFSSKAKVWNKDHFGNIFLKKKKILRAKLKGIQVALASRPNYFLVELEKRIIGEYADLSKIEEEFWAMKSRVNLLVQGDRKYSFLPYFCFGAKEMESYCEYEG